MLVEDEEAADAIMAAIGRLSYEQLQVVEVHPQLCDCLLEHHLFVNIPVSCLLSNISMMISWPQISGACRDTRCG